MAKILKKNKIRELTLQVIKPQLWIKCCTVKKEKKKAL